ncbi:hypothetical protein FD755_016276 [Muntiacus reevesi]|uniref:Uncharacterized protein n=1 Tax=Muntiacus reevesi TaxID=9886 RepID=A0A5N3XGU8_MUNRE|nr:hypothetical protein FD755_016276 [Muntiacus reevesi]
MHTDKVNLLQRRVTSRQQQDRHSEAGDAHMDNQDKIFGSWFKFTIPFGIKYDEKWLLNLIQKQCGVPFITVEFHYEKMQAQFFVENANIACALKNDIGKIFSEDEKGRGGISISVGPCDTSESVQRALKSEKKWHGCSLHIHPGIINEKHYLVHGLSTIMENASTTKNVNLSNTEVKAAGEMDEGQQLEPEGMCADRNDVCTTFPDMSTILRSSALSPSLELFPRLLSLGGQETPSVSKCAVEAPKFLTTCKGNFFGSEELKSLILQFLQYYLIHDYGDRLLGAYHEEVCFSLTIPFQPEDTALSMCAYFLDKRNMNKFKDPLLKHTKHDFMHALCALPKTQLVFSFFVVDMCFQVEMMLCFSVNGMFKERLSRVCVRLYDLRPDLSVLPCVSSVILPSCRPSLCFPK